MQESKCRLGMLLCAVIVVVIFVYCNVLLYSTKNKNRHKLSTASDDTVQFHNRGKSHRPFITVSMNVPVSGPSLKYGFQWLREQNTVDAVIVNKKTNASVLEHLVFNESKKLQITCPQQVRMGTKEDGGWDVCIAGPYNIVKPCLVYSFGMGGEWSFDHMITSPLYECLDFSYDPSLGKPDHKPNPLLWFYNTGLGGTDGVNSKNWSLKTFPTLLRENNHVNSTIDILKMDIEYSEWDALETMLARPSCLANVKQLMIEFHTHELDRITSSRDDLASYWHILRGIYRIGFKLWNMWDNPTCNFRSKWNPQKSYCGCFNMYFLNVKYLI